MPLLSFKKNRVFFTRLGGMLLLALVAVSAVFFLNPSVRHPVPGFSVPGAQAGEFFKTQIVKMTIPVSSLASTAVAPADFDAVDPERTIALISDVTQHSAAIGVSRASSARVELTDGETITATRFQDTSLVSVWVLLIEYTGPEGGPDEFIVRDRRAFAWPDGLNTQTYGPIGSVVDSDDVVMFVAGASHEGPGDGHRFADVIASMDGTSIVTVETGDAEDAGTPVDLVASVQAVEFTGANWSIQTGSTVPAPYPGGTDVAVNDVGDVSDTWVYFTHRTNNAPIEERGHRVFLTSETNVRVQEDLDAGATKLVRWYLLTNPNLNVQTGSADDVFETDLTQTITGFASVASRSRSFAWVDGLSDPAAAPSAVVAGIWLFELSDTGTISLERLAAAHAFSYFYQVVEFPPGTSDGGFNELDFPANVALSINDGAACTPSRSVELSLTGQHVTEVVISNTPQFLGAAWEAFASPDVQEWRLEEGDGEKTVYAIFRSAKQNLSNVLEAKIRLDEQGRCGRAEEKAEIPPMPSAPVCQVDCRALQYDLYIVNEDGTQHHLLDAHAQDRGNGVYAVAFEDSVDGDYNDVVVEFEVGQCPLLRVVRTWLDARIHHQIRLRVWSDTGRSQDILLWPDSHESARIEVPTDLRQYPLFCSTEGVNE